MRQFFSVLNLHQLRSADLRWRTAIQIEAAHPALISIAAPLLVCPVQAQGQHDDRRFLRTATTPEA